jgi:hypothetical protein
MGFAARLDEDRSSHPLAGDEKRARPRSLAYSRSAGAAQAGQAPAHRGGIRESTRARQHKAHLAASRSAVAPRGATSDSCSRVDRFATNNSRKGKGKTARIELATATTADFESWLAWTRSTDPSRGDVCISEPPKPKAPVQSACNEAAPKRPPAKRHPRAAQDRFPR